MFRKIGSICIFRREERVVCPVESFRKHNLDYWTMQKFRRVRLYLRTEIDPVS
jgi:hypothetical protein